MIFSETDERATLIDSDDSDIDQDPSFSSKKQTNKTKGPKKGLQVKEGQLALHITGYPGIQVISASELIHCIPLAKIKVAAKKFLKRSGVKKKRKQKKKSKIQPQQQQHQHVQKQTKEKDTFSYDRNGSTI